MKKKNVLLPAALLLAFGVMFTACNKDDNPVTAPSTTRLTATINGVSEKPASTTSTATGNFTGDLNTTTRVLSYTVTYSGLTPTGGHLHRINQSNGTGPVDVPFTSLTSPIIGTTAALPQTKVDSMLAGQYYVNLHTATYPAGEIRGDIKRQ